MAAKAEVTGQFAFQYVRALKRDKGRILDEVVAVTGWSRDNARRRLVAAAKMSLTEGGRVNGYRTKKPVTKPRKPRKSKYSYDSLKVLQRVWAISGGMCGKYLTAAMELHLDLLESFGELKDDARYSPAVRVELLSMSAATIDRYLKPVKAKALKGKATTRPSPLLRNSITVRKAGDEVEDEPGFFEGDTVAHCGPSLRGEFARTLNLTDVKTGWVFTHTMRNNARKHVLEGLRLALERIPFEVTGLDFDNGSEFLNYDVVAWASSQGVYFTRSRPYKKNDQATIESKNGHLVRQYAFYYRYDTATERKLLNQLWELVNDRFNYLTPTMKPIGYAETAVGKRKRIYDKPKTPLERLLDAGVLSPTQTAELMAYRASLNPAELARKIAALQERLTRLAKDKTRQLHLISQPKPPIPTATGIHLKAI